MIKYYGFSWNEVVREISFPNLMMLSATIPDAGDAGTSEEAMTVEQLQTML